MLLVIGTFILLYFKNCIQYIYLLIDKQKAEEKKENLEVEN